MLRKSEDYEVERLVVSFGSRPPFMRKVPNAPCSLSSTLVEWHRNPSAGDRFCASKYDERDAAPGERNQRPRGGAREVPDRPDPAAHPRTHRRRRWGLRPGHCTYPDAVYLDRR